MKIVLDLTRLVREGKLSAEQAAELQALASRDTGSLAINALMSFGAIAVAAGILTLNPSYATGAVLGTTFVLIGLGMEYRLAEQWRLLATASTIIGGLLLAGGLIGLLDGGLVGFVLAALLLFSLALLIRSGLLMAIVPLALAAALGSSTGYFHASYMLLVTEPTITILLFAVLAWASYEIGQRVPAAYETLSLVLARMSLVLVNFGFWVGSLWGDYPGESWRHAEIYGSGTSSQDREAWRAATLHLPDYVFVVTWAVLIVGIGVWAARVNRRWVVNLAAVFGAIHVYTQWFERLGADPFSVILAGISVVAIAVLLWRYNVTRDSERRNPRSYRSAAL
jgi:iron complex transport system permease protein